MRRSNPACPNPVHGAPQAATLRRSSPELILRPDGIGTMRRLVPALLLLTCALLVVGPSGWADERPNILFIMADDHGPWAGGFAGNRQALTPNLDQLAQDGCSFTNAFSVTPVCSPSRAELMTSRYGSEIGITEWLHPRRDRGVGLDPTLPTWPRLLQQAGYRTGLIGKWHLGLEDRYHPTRLGYGYFMGFRGGGNRPADPRLEKDGKVKQFKGFLPDILADEAISFIRRHRDEPFALSLHFRAPHAPWLPVRDEAWAPYRDLDPALPHPDYPGLDVPRAKRMMREYLASVRSLDLAVGRVLRALDELGLAQKTVVIYTSDHGYNMAHNGIWHKGNGHWLLRVPPPATKNIPRGQRPNMYDNSLKVPLIIRWPGKVPGGSQVTRTVSHLDFFPTLLAIAGVDVPEGAVIRGRNFLPLLLGEDVPWDDDLYAEYSTRHQSRTHMRCYRTPEWKLVRDFLNPNRDELYHLARDPEEKVNLIDSTDPAARQIIRDLHERILERMRAIGDPVLDQVRDAG